MTTREVTREPLDETLIAKVKATPAGTITRVPGCADTSVYGPVEVAWYPDHVTITALDAGPCVTEARPGRDGRSVVVEIRPPSVDRLPDGLPGAD